MPSNSPRTPKSWPVRTDARAAETLIRVTTHAGASETLMTPSPPTGPVKTDAGISN